MSNSESSTFCNLNQDWFNKKKGQKLFYFIDEDINPRVSKFSKNKEEVNYELNNATKGSFKVKSSKKKIL